MTQTLRMTPEPQRLRALERANEVRLARAELKLTALALGLIIGGALGNGIDRVVYGAVVDFVLFHITTKSFNFVWYVFNLADAAIVAGVIGLLYEYVLGAAPQKRPDPP